MPVPDQDTSILHQDHHVDFQQLHRRLSPADHVFNNKVAKMSLPLHIAVPTMLSIQSIPLTARVPILLFAATASHVALTLPSVELTGWEAITTRDLGLESQVKGGIWVKSGLWACKTLVWLSTAYELAVIVVHTDPFSPVSQRLLEWLPNGFLDVPWDINTPYLTRSSALGIALIVLGAYTHLSARFALGKHGRAPIIVRPSASRRSLYVPPSQLPATSVNSQDPFFPTRANKDGNAEGSGYQAQWTLRSGHQLVQSGPYKRIRHPMYAGALLALAGSGLFYLSSGSFTHALVDNHSRLSSAVYPSRWLWRLRDEWETVGFAWQFPVERVTWAGIAAFALGVATLGTLIGLVRMVQREDEALEERFGKQWVFYRWSVPSKFVPGIF